MDVERGRQSWLFVAALVALGTPVPSRDDYSMTASEIRFALPAGVIDETPYAFVSGPTDRFQ